MADETLDWRDLFDYAAGRANSGGTERSRAAFAAIRDALRSHAEYRRMPAGQILDDLVQNQLWKQEHRADRPSLSGAADSLGSVLADPAAGRRTVDRLRAAQWMAPRYEPESLADEVSRHARGSVVIQTCAAPGASVLRAGGPSSLSTLGFETFGDGAASQRDWLRQDAGPEGGSLESVEFTPVAQRTVAGPDGPEPAVRFAYGYDVGQVSTRRDDLPEYGTPAYGQPGNTFQAEAVLPRSVAERLQRAVEADPAQARAVVERLVLRNGGLDPAAWHGRGAYERPMRPPFENVPVTEPLKLKSSMAEGAPVERLVRAGESPSEFVSKFVGHGGPGTRGVGEGGNGARQDPHRIRTHGTSAHVTGRGDT